MFLGQWPAEHGRGAKRLKVALKMSKDCNHLNKYTCWHVLLNSTSHRGRHKSSHQESMHKASQFHDMQLMRQKKTPIVKWGKVHHMPTCSTVARLLLSTPTRARAAASFDSCARTWLATDADTRPAKSTLLWDFALKSQSCNGGSMACEPDSPAWPPNASRGSSNTCSPLCPPGPPFAALCRTLLPRTLLPLKWLSSFCRDVTACRNHVCGAAGAPGGVLMQE